ncbi:MAG: hypothetical protein AB8G15_10300 [Saprospiraceae bacterium]
MKSAKLILWSASIFACVLMISSCTEKETIVVEDNDAPTLYNIPLIKIQNYVNRVFIDLIGREPIDGEMDDAVSKLKNADLARSARINLINELQTSEAFIEGDTSYARAYYQQLYNISKVKFLEGVSEVKLRNDFLNTADTQADVDRILALLSARQDMQNGQITIDQLFARMIHNIVFDQINMNSFNFVNASFDNLLWRYPTDAEFTEGYKMVEYNTAGEIFDQIGQTKSDYVAIMTNSREMFEGILIWTHQQLLSRRPTTEETFFLLEDFYSHRDIRLIQQHIMSLDEYANF